jgi:hypothetical protein
VDKTKLESKMKTIAIIAASFCLAGAAMAQAPAPSPSATAGATCKTQIAPKNLHGAALTSADKKCCTDAATAQKLNGAAKTSFVKACTTSAGS